MIADLRLLIWKNVADGPRAGKTLLANELTFDEPTEWDEAVELMMRKGLMPTAGGSAALRDMQQGIKLRAFFSARMTNAGFLDRAQKLAAKIAGGPDEEDFAARARGDKALLMSIPEAKAQLLEYLKSTGYMPSEEDRGTLRDFSSDARLQLIVETNVRDVQGYARWMGSQNEMSLYGNPAWELVRLRHSKVPRDWEERWEAAREGTQEEGSTEAGERMVALKNHPIWQALGDGIGGYEDTLGNPWPPFAFNSGMGVIDVNRDDALALGIMDEGTRIDPQEDPGGLDGGGNVEASVEGYAEFLTDIIKDIKGLRVTDGKVTLGNANQLRRQSRSDSLRQVWREGGKVYDDGIEVIPGGIPMLRDNIGRIIGMLLPNMGTSEGAYKGWETRRGAIARDMKAVRKATRIARTRKRGTPGVLQRGKYRIDMPYGRPGTLDPNKLDDGYGSAHLDYQHSPEELHQLPVTLARGSVHEHESPDKLYVVSGQHVAVLTAARRNDGGISQTRYGLTTHFKDIEKADRVITTRPALVEAR